MTGDQSPITSPERRGLFAKAAVAGQSFRLQIEPLRGEVKSDIERRRKTPLAKLIPLLLAPRSGRW